MVAQRDEFAPLHVWMAPAWQEITSRAAQKSLAVMCPACSRSPHGLLALMGSANRGLITRTGSMSRRNGRLLSFLSRKLQHWRRGLLSRHSPGLVFLLAQHHRPGNARRLVR